MQQRSALELIWKSGVAQVGGHQCVSGALKGRDKFDGIISVGKAATPMLEAALAHSGYDTNSLLVTKYDHVRTHHKFNQDKLLEYSADGSLQIIEAGHPVPDGRSLKAGRALVEFVRKMAIGSKLLVLVSGGASSLAELLPGDVSLEELQNDTNAMLSAGLDISAINLKRKGVSLIKDGKLLAGFAGERVEVLAISDVQGDLIEVIGSGIGMINRVDDRVVAKMDIVASNEIARVACVQKARLLGFEAVANEENLYADVADAAARISRCVKNGSDGVYVFGGEPTMVLPRNPGQGGRNQHLALLLAQKFSGETKLEFLVAGSDGSDGPTNAAGGFGDGDSFNKQTGGSAALNAADAGSFLENCGDLFVTGPTGTNVMDLAIVIKG